MKHKSKETKAARKRRKMMKQSAKSSRRLALTVVAIVGMAIIATGAAITRQNAKMKEESSQQASKATAPTTTAANRNYVTVKVAGQDVQVDSQTGQIRPLTQEEAQKMAAGLKKEINQSTEGLTATTNADGSISVDLQGRFQNVAVARRNTDGTITEGCVDNAQAAGEFFGIDPRMIDEKAQPLQARPRNMPAKD